MSTTSFQFPIFYSTPWLTLLQTIVLYLIPHSLATHATSTYYLWIVLLIFLLLRSLMVDFIFIFSFYFIFLLFSIFRTTRVRVYQSRCYISHKLMAKSQDWSQDLEEWSRRFWNKVTSYNMDNTYWPHVIHMVIRVRCTVVSTDHE